MNDDSRAKRAAHPSHRSVIRLGPADAPALHAYLASQDVWPRPSEHDLAEFLGRNDAAVFALCEASLTATVACAVDGITLHLQWVYPGQMPEVSLHALVDAVSSFGRDKSAALLYARAAQGGPAHALLSTYGFVEDEREGNVVQGEPALSVGLVKVLEP
jgi:hypothetical protein